MKGKIIIITAPSGSGKTSIARYLLNKYPVLAFSVSAATRTPRDNEKNGEDYYFMSVEEFQKKIYNKEFMEWEMVYEDKYYGTLKSEMERLWSLGKVAILDIDVKGAIHVQKQYPENSLSIFIEPPSVDELKKRLQGRGLEIDQPIDQVERPVANLVVDAHRIFAEHTDAQRVERAKEAARQDMRCPTGDRRAGDEPTTERVQGQAEEQRQAPCCDHQTCV